MSKMKSHLLIFLSVVFFQQSVSIHVKGKWNTKDLYLFLSKFGFQKTDPQTLSDSQGFIYGNITTKSQNVNSYFTLVLVDSEYFLELYGNSTKGYTSATCGRMFNKIDTFAWDSRCNSEAKQDFLRKIPCPQNRLCIDEDEPKNVLPGYQFTYKVQNTQEPRYWYLSFVACHRGTDCRWKRNSSLNFEIDYDIWLVNGNPDSKHLNPFEHQFSFEFHDVVEIYFIFVVLYIITIPIWIYAYRKQIHPLTKMLTVCICTEFAGVVLNLLHVFIFSFNGVGAEFLKVIGNFLGIFSECLFMLILLMVAKGWTITSMKLSSKKSLFGVWGIYTGLNALFFIIGLTKVNIITNTDEWNSWPGYLIIGFRIVVMGWFVWELRGTARMSRYQARLDFFQQFAAYYLVWFVYLPIVVIVATQISHLWRYKTILSITYTADWISYVVMIHLLWPSKSVLYLIKGDTPLPQYDLEAAGLTDFDDIEETIFESPGKSPNEQSANKTEGKAEQEHEVNVKQNGRIISNGSTYSSIALDSEEEDYELL